jgi:hypothetical protein
MAFTSYAQRLQTSADRYYRSLMKASKLALTSLSVSENALMQKYDPGKPAIVASNPSLEFCGFRP